MADIKEIKTTSSKSLVDVKNENGVATSTTVTTQMPLKGDAETQILNKLAQNLSESYQIVRRRQQKFNNLSYKVGGAADSTLATQPDDSGGEWQEVCSAKNKLKRKKKLSASLTSVTDSVNQEKRTRIEGIHLNCRGKLQINEVPAITSTTASTPINTATPTTPTTAHNCTGAVAKTERVGTKPPIAPATPIPAARNAANATTTATVVKIPPPRLKRKLQENMLVIQKLNALTEQLRLELNELKSNLTTERGAVRVLRAQNESETRKWKNEVKKLQNTLELCKKNNNAVLPNMTKKSTDNIQTNAENMPGSLVNYELQRLTNEIIALKEANKALEEKKMINCDADRRKAADMRTLKDSYEIRLTQLQKSAKNEISRLLEEIKTKERSIGQLKKDVQVLQNKKHQQNDLKSRNATTNNNNNNNNTNSIVTNTTTNKTTNKPKKSNATKQTNEIKTTTIRKDASTPKDASQVQNPNEMKKLKDIELINNTKNLQNNNNNNSNNSNNVNLKTNTTTITATKILNNTTQNTLTNKCNNSNNNNILDINEIYDETNKMLLNDENFNSSNKNNNNNNNSINTKIISTCGSIEEVTEKQQPQYHSMPHELTERLLGTTAITTTTKTAARAKSEQNDMSEYRAKDSNSDSDSALSSAPPSISPQPPPAGLDTADIWQTIRTYTTDIEKLQKDIEILQKENEQLHIELNLAKEHILESEKLAMRNNNNTKCLELKERIKYLEDQEHQLQAESNELREQNELLEFRILELEETNDKWSLQSNASPSNTPSSSTTTTAATTASQSLTQATIKDVWGCTKPNKDDPMQILFGTHNSIRNMDSGITSPQSQRHIEEDFNLLDVSNDELRVRITNMLKKTTIDEDDKQCLQQLLTLVQQLDIYSQRSGPDSLNTTSSSSDEPNSLELIKSRISDYSSASSSSSARSTYDNIHNSKTSKSNAPQTTNSRIVATVLPYNSTQQQQQQQPQQQPHHQHAAPTNTPADSPRKTRQAWQSNSLSESGVFVESDFLSDASENNVCTQTDFDDEQLAANAKELYSELQKLQRPENKIGCKVPANAALQQQTQLSPNLSDLKRLQYYKDRLELLESKVLIYESSGDLQAKRLADRLQREIQLEKQLKELQDRVDFLEGENSALEEEKCEFEEAENDTRLRLQRLEVDLEILSQRNIELEMSREALSAKYKECRSECLILREDLAVSETQIRHLEEDKQKAKENFEFLRRVLPLLLIYNSLLTTAQLKKQQTPQLTLPGFAENAKMGDVISLAPSVSTNTCERSPSLAQFERDEALFNSCSQNMDSSLNQQRDVHYLKEEIKCLRHQIKELNARHYEAMESADSHWVDLEREYKDREEALHAKEICLKQKINKLQDCLRDDTRAAHEKIMQMEEAEKELKCCLLRVSKEHRDILEEHQNIIIEYERFKEQYEQLKEQQKPMSEALEQERKRGKTLSDELAFMRKLQQETEVRSLAENETTRNQLHNIKKDYLHIEVTNSELKEEVATLEQQILALQSNEKECTDKIRCLTDEVRSKEEMCQKLEKRLERSEGYSLADELNGSPSKRFKREDVKDLKSASRGLGASLRNMKDCENTLPSHHQFQLVARDVKKLADTLLRGESLEEEAQPQKSSPKLILTEITRI